MSNGQPHKVWSNLTRLARYVGRRFQPSRIITSSVATLSRDPPVFYTGYTGDLPLGIAPAFAVHFGNIPAGFLIHPTWSIEADRTAARIAAAARLHRKAFPDHLLLFLCNSRRETDLLNHHGQPAVLLNRNVVVSEDAFRPLPDAIIAFDAVYNAKLLPFKRHELAADIDRVAYVSYAQEEEGFGLNHQRKLLASVLAGKPGHRLLNPTDNGLPVRMAHEETNAAINRATVGLCLSEVEGANYASMEYMLAGLPVVSTPSRGGRDEFFDPDVCLICDPNPRAVRDAVAALRARGIPRNVVRAKVLAKIEPGRREFLAIADDFIERLGGRRRYDGAWPFSQWSPLAEWRPIEAHLRDFERHETQPVA